MKQVLNSIRFFAVIAIFAVIILLVFLVEKRVVQNLKRDIENSKNTRVSGNNVSQ